MSPDALLAELGWVIAAAAVALLATRPLRLPPVLVYVAAGLVLGPVTGVIHPSESTHLIGEVGIALLLFLVGLELSPAAIRDVGRNALVIGGVQVAVCTALGALAGHLFGYTVLEALLLGLAVAFSSTVVVVKLLGRLGQLTAPHGRLSVGILLVQDVVVAIVLTLMAGLGSAGNLSTGAVLEGVGRAFGGLAVLVGVAALAARLVLPPLVRWMARAQDAVLVWSLTWCFVFIVAAELLGLSVELGAFMAGLTLAPTVVHGELRRRVQPLADLFLAIFFVVLGAELQPGAAFESLPTVLALIGLVLVAKPLVLGVLSRWAGRLDPRTSTLTASTLGQMSEFSFILAAAAVAAGLVADELVSIIGLAGVVTIGISAALVQSQATLWRRWGPARRAAHDGTSEAGDGDRPARLDHTVVVGMNSLGRRLVEALVARGERVVAVDTDPFKLEGLESETLQGSTDHWSVLTDACVPEARLVVSALRIEDANSLLAYRCCNLGVPVGVHAFDQSVRADLEALGVDYLMDSKREGARRLRDSLIELEVLDG